MRNRSIEELIKAVQRKQGQLENERLDPRMRHIYEGLHHIYMDELRDLGALKEYQEALKWRFEYGTGFKKR